MRVLVAARDIRVRRALSGLLRLDGHRVVGAVHTADLMTDTSVAPEVVVLELVPGNDAEGLQVVRQLASRGHAVIAVGSGWNRGEAVLARGAVAWLDEDDQDFADRLAEAVRAAIRPGPAGADPHPGRSQD